MPRHDLKAYTTLMARLPQELADQVKQYASQHRCTVSELIRDGLEMRLEAGEVPGRSTGHSRDAGGEVIHEVIQVLPEVLHTLSPMLMAQIQDTIRTTVTEVLQGMTEVLPGHTSLPQPHTQGMPAVLPFETPSAASTGGGVTEVVPIEPTLTPAPQMTEGHTTVIPLVPTTQHHAEGMTEVVPIVPAIPEPSEVLHDVIPPMIMTVHEGMTEVVQEVMSPVPPTDSEGITAVIQTITQPAPEVLPGDTSTPQPHAPSAEQGHTEVLPHDTTTAPSYRQDLTEVVPDRTSPSLVDQQGMPTVLPKHTSDDFDATRFALGKLCVNGHAYGDTGQTLYRLPKYVCPPCDAARARERRARRTAAAREG